MSDAVFEVSRKLMVDIDSLLSCLNHRHGNKLREIGELDEVKYLATRVRKITESREPESAVVENECNCVENSVNRTDALRGHGSPSNHPEFASWICPKHGYKRL